MVVKVDNNTSMLQIGSKIISMKQFLKEFGEQYAKLYDGVLVLSKEEENKLIVKGDNFIKENKEFMLCLFNARHDCVSSDREVLALVLALEKFNKSACESTKNKVDNIYAVALRDVYGKPNAIALKIPRNENLVGYVKDCKVFNIFNTWKEAKAVAEDWNIKYSK